MAITSYLCKRLFCRGSRRTLEKSPQSTRPSLQIGSVEQAGFGRSRREYRSSKLTCPPSRVQISGRHWAWRAADRGFDPHIAGSWPCSCVSSPDCVLARRAARPAGFRGKNGRPEAFCVARLGVVPVGRLGMSSRFGFGPVGGVERLRRSRGRFWVPFEFSIQKYVCELGCERRSGLSHHD